MKKQIATLGIAGTLVFGAFSLTDVDVVSQFGSIPEAKTINFGEVIPHTLTVSNNGEIEIATIDKSYKILPIKTEFDTKEATKGKEFFLDFETSVDEVKIKDVFGKGSDIEVKNSENKVSKVVSFTQDFLKTIPQNAKYVEVSFDVTGFSIPNGTYDSRIEIDKNVWLEKSLAWDSSGGDPNGNYTDIEVEIKDGVLTKKISVEWLKNATYPIYTDAVFTFGTKQLADAGPSGAVDIMNIGTNKYVTCWSDTADASTEIECVVATVSGTTSTFGSLGTAIGDSIGTNNAGIGGCSAGADRWVVLYSGDPTAGLYAKVGSSTGTTINGFSATSTIAIPSSYNVGNCTYVSTDKIVIAYGNQSNQDAEAKACTIGSDYLLTCGATTTLQSLITTTANDASCDTLDTDKFICFYTQNGALSWVQAGTVSGTTITAGTSVQVTTTGGDTLGHTIISPATDKFAVTWGASTQTTQGLALGTVSGTTITLGATTTAIIATSTSFTSLLEIDADSAGLYYQQGVADAATTFLAFIPIELNFGALTFSTSTTETVDTTTDPGSLHAVKISDCKFAFVWEDDNDTNDLFAEIGDLVNCGGLGGDHNSWFMLFE